MLFDKYLKDTKKQLGIDNPSKSRLARIKRFFGQNKDAIALKYSEQDGELIHHYKGKLKSSGLKSP